MSEHSAATGSGRSRRGPIFRGLRFRGLRIAAITVILVLLIGAVWWFLWVPEHRPTLDEAADEIHAIDVSNHQGTIDWPAVNADGIDAAMIKATEGDDYVDPLFEENWRNAEDAGVRRGAYHFFTLCSPGAEQAQNFLKSAPPDADALAPAVDLELIGACEARPPQAKVDAELENFRHIVESAWGQPLLVYARGSFISKYSIGALADRPRWVTNFFLRPADDDWTMWQVHYFAKVDGIEGKVDLDVLRSGGRTDDG